MKSSVELYRELEQMRFCGPDKNCSYSEYEDKCVEYHSSCIREEIDRKIVADIIKEFNQTGV